MKTCTVQACASKARELLPAAVVNGSRSEAADARDIDRPLTAREAKALLVPLVRLRQACCHPQVRLSLVPIKTPLACVTAHMYQDSWWYASTYDPICTGRQSVLSR